MASGEFRVETLLVLRYRKQDSGVSQPSQALKSCEQKECRRALCYYSIHVGRTPKVET